MTLTEEANGATVTTATETTVNEITSDDLEYWGATVFIPSSFTTGDAMEIRFLSIPGPLTLLPAWNVFTMFL